MLKVTINDTTYSLEIKNNESFINEEPWHGDLVKIRENLYHLIKDSKSYTIEVVAAETKQLQLKINGVNTVAVVQDKYDLLLEQLGMQQLNDTRTREVRAPMPGMILDVLVKQGQVVTKGEKLLILEAMKMENVIKSAGEGTIEAVNVKKGMSVEKNQVLIQF
jgi:biotin carboxyl carrier protein